MNRCVIEVVCGKLELIEAKGYLISCSWTKADVVAPVTGLLKQAEQELREYFSGERQIFTVPLAASGTEFECTLWEDMATIPFGTTLSYSKLARRMGHPGAVRAVGNGCGKNPLCIFIPCHRVKGSDTDGGYTPGMEYKYALWKIEHIS